MDRKLKEQEDAHDGVLREQLQKQEERSRTQEPRAGCWSLVP